MEFSINQINKFSSFSPNLTLYRINDSIYDEINYRDNMFYIIRRCGVVKWTPRHEYDTYVTDNDILIYALPQEEIYEEYFEYDEILKTAPEYSVISVSNGAVKEDHVNISINQQDIEYIDLYHGSRIDIDTSNYDHNKESYVYKIKNNMPHELVNSSIEADNYTSPSVTIHGLSSQNSEPSIDKQADFGHIGEFDGEKYRISVGQKIKLANLNPLQNKWFVAQYNTQNYTDLNSLKKLRIEGSGYIDDELIQQSGVAVHKILPDLPLTILYVAYAKAYVWCDEERTIKIGSYNGYLNALWVNGKRAFAGGYLNNGNPYNIDFKKGINLIEMTARCESGGGGYFNMRGYVGGVYTVGAPVSQYDGISFLTYNNKYLKSVISKDNEDFYFVSPISLKSIGETCDTYEFSENESTVTKRIDECTVDSYDDFKDEGNNKFSIRVPVELEAEGTSYNFDESFETLEYITSNGTDWYNTGIVLKTENVKAHMKFMLTANVSSKNLIGSSTNGDSQFFTQYFYGSNTFRPYLGTSNNLTGYTVATNTLYDWSLETTDGGKFYHTFNNATTVGTYNGSVQNDDGNAVEIFRQPVSSNPAGRVPNGIRIYEFQIYLDGKIAIDLIPVKRRSDGKLGLYDTIRNIFHYGAGLELSYVDGKVEVLSNKFKGVRYLDLRSSGVDAISYNDNRLYFYSEKGEEAVRNAISTGLKLLYKTKTPITIKVENPSDVLNNKYEETEEINIMPGHDSMNLWKISADTDCNKCDDGSFNIHYNKTPDGTSRYVYKEFQVEKGRSYTISVKVKGSVYGYICASNSDSVIYTICNTRNIVGYTEYSYTFTSDRTAYRFRIGSAYEADAFVKDLKLVENNYVASYIATNTNGETVDVELDYSMSYAYSKQRELIEVEAEKTYVIKRPASGDVWQLRYYDSNKRIIGYSDYLDTSKSEADVTIPHNCFYIDIMDGVNIVSSGYSVKLKESNNKVVTEINELIYHIGNDTKTISLPCSLHPGDELVYDPYYKEWTYYPFNEEDDFIVYPISEFNELRINGSTYVAAQDDIMLTVAINCISSRELERPQVVSLVDAQDSGKYGFGCFEWNEVIGAEEYDIYVGDGKIASIDNIIDAGTFSYDFTGENNGLLKIVAKNQVEHSTPSYMHNVCTVPNTPKMKLFDSIYENNRFYLDATFDVNSKMVDYYLLSYSIDGASPTTIELEGNYGAIEELTRAISFISSNISDNVTITISAVNETGVNNYMIPAVYKATQGFTKWTYKQALNQVLLAWTDDYENEEYYLIKYSVENGEWLEAQTDKGLGSGEQLLEYLSLLNTQEMRVCIAPVIDGQRQIFSKPIKVSKALDKTLIPPASFSGVKVRNGLIQFSWDDNYGIADTRFELSYKYSDGTSQVISIGHASAGNSNYTYRINTDTYGFATAKVKMIWELGESEYSNELTIYDLPDAEAPPDMKHQERSDGGKVVKISWETYDFVKEYTLSLTVDGKQHHITCIEPYYEYSIPANKNRINISASVRAINIGGEQTSYSDEITFTVCNQQYKQAQTIYVHSEQEKDMITTIVGNGLVSPYYMYTLSSNKFYKYYPYYDKSYKPYVESIYRFEDNYWGHGVGHSGRVFSWISNHANKEYDLNQLSYQKIDKEYPVHYTIFLRALSEYRLYSEFTKMIIACFGDSITAGHPNYWAETGTGDVTSQYEYWLSRRLKDEYDVVNKGYGQEKTNDMLERFDRDIKGLGAHYCIILGGTNDWYQDASTKDLETGYTVMDGAIDNIKQIVSKCWDNNIYAIVGTLTPRNDITEDGKRLFDYFNDWVKDWTTEQSLLGKKCAYIDFFNAGKDMDPPCPLEDPDKPYHLNPLCDGDNVYDENGTMIRSGLGVHMNIQGYKVMGYSIPLTLFASNSVGFKLYKDSECTDEEYLNTEEASNQFYEITVKNVRRGIDKSIIKYIKNIGNYPCLYYIYISDAKNMDYYFVDENGNKTNYLIGSCGAGVKKQLNIVMNTKFEDYTSSFKIRMISRELTSANNDL